MKKKESSRELIPPPIAQSNQDAIEILRAWAAPGEKQQLTLQTCWKDPGAWGIMLVDIARHVAKAYEHKGHDYGEVYNRIRELIEIEFSNPTDEPDDITSDS